MKTRNIPVRPALLALALAHALPLWAAEDAKSQLDRVIVTGSRSPVTLRDTLASATVIDRAEIERLQARNLQDLLRGRAGLFFSNNGGQGKATSLFMRGAESDHVLVLVDGVRMGPASSGGFSWQDLPIEQVERVEIVRGPYSSLYGSEAIGGVIQIFTRRAHRPLQPSFSLGIGSEGSQTASAGLSGQSAQGWYAVNLAQQKTDGFNACRGRAAVGSWGQPGYVAGAGCFADDPDRDGYRNRSASLRGGLSFADGWQVDANALLVRARNVFDGSFVNEAEVRQRVLAAGVQQQVNEHWHWSLRLGRSADHAENYKDGIWRSTFNTDRSQAGWQANVKLGQGQVVAGFDWQRDDLESDTAYSQTRRDNRAIFVETRQAFGRHAVQVSARHDHTRQFGGKGTGSVQWGWQLNDALRLSAGWGTAFKAPTFNELYYPGYGNAALKPETSRSIELGLRGEHGWGSWHLQAYENRVDNLIAHDASIFAPGNVDRARIRGAELSGETAFAGWQLRAAFTYLQPKNESAGQYGKWLPRRARQSGRVDIERSFGDVELGLTVVGAGKRYDDLANRRPLAGYGSTDLRLGWRFAPGWQVQAALENVFDKAYETAEFYPQPGRTWLVTLRYGGE